LSWKIFEFYFLGPEKLWKTVLACLCEFCQVCCKLSDWLTIPVSQLAGSKHWTSMIRLCHCHRLLLCLLFQIRSLFSVVWTFACQLAVTFTLPSYSYIRFVSFLLTKKFSIAHVIFASVLFW